MLAVVVEIVQQQQKKTQKRQNENNKIQKTSEIEKNRGWNKPIQFFPLRKIDWFLINHPIFPLEKN